MLFQRLIGQVADSVARVIGRFGPAVVVVIAGSCMAGAATVDRVTATFTSGTRSIGEVVQIRVTFTEPILVMTNTGTPTLLLETGATDRAVPYLSLDGPDTMHFEYTVQKADLAGELDFASTAALSLNGGLIRDYALANATPTLPAPGAAGSLGFFADFVIDGVRPTVTFIAPAAPADPTRSAVTFAVVFSEPVLNVTSDDFAVTTTRTAMGTISSVIPLPNTCSMSGL